MSQEFDPYYEWLGIAPEEQPADHYRLLGLRKYEDKKQVISNASDQRLAYLRTFQTGVHADDAIQIMNLITQATRCLLDDEKKKKYDTLVRSWEPPVRPAAPKPTPSANVKSGTPAASKPMPRAVPLPTTPSPTRPPSNSPQDFTLAPVDERPKPTSGFPLTEYVNDLRGGPEPLKPTSANGPQPVVRGAHGPIRFCIPSPGTYTMGCPKCKNPVEARVQTVKKVYCTRCNALLQFEVETAAASAEEELLQEVPSLMASYVSSSAPSSRRKLDSPSDDFQRLYVSFKYWLLDHASLFRTMIGGVCSLAVFYIAFKLAWPYLENSFGTVKQFAEKAVNEGLKGQPAPPETPPTANQVNPSNSQNNTSTNQVTTVVNTNDTSPSTLQEDIDRINNAENPPMNTYPDEARRIKPTSTSNDAFNTTSNPPLAESISATPQPLARIALDLPATDKSGATILLNAPLSIENLKLFLLHEAADLPAGAAIFVEQDTAKASRWIAKYTENKADFTQSGQELAEFLVSARGIAFRWLVSGEDVHLPREQLRNCLLQLFSGQQVTNVIQLRGSRKSQAPLLSYDAKTVEVSAELEHFPLEKSLFVEFDPIPGGKFEPEDGRVALGKDAKFHFTGLPGALIAIRFVRIKNKYAVKMAPVFEESTGVVLEMTYPKLQEMTKHWKEVGQQSLQSINAANKQLASLQAEQVSVARMPATTPFEEAARSNQMARVETNMRLAADRIPKLQAKVIEMEARLAALPQVLAFMSSQERKPLPFRMEATAGDDKLVLLDHTQLPPVPEAQPNPNPVPNGYPQNPMIPGQPYMPMRPDFPRPAPPNLPSALRPVPR